MEQILMTRNRVEVLTNLSRSTNHSYPLNSNPLDYDEETVAKVFAKRRRRELMGTCKKLQAI